MKRIFFTLIIIVLAQHILANYAWNNYRPDNAQVKLNQTNLPIVFINVDGAVIDRYERITARMKIIDNGEGSLNYADTLANPGQHVDYEGYIALRYRGNSSYSSSDKKPYSFRTLDAPLEDGGQKVKVKIMGMSKDNNWALLAPYADKSMMRDVLAFELSRPWMDYTPHAKFCELFLDGIYYGVYVMTEVVSKGKHRLNLDDPGNEGDALTGGYLLEIDRNDEVTHRSKYHPVNKQGATLWSRYIYVQYKSPDYEDMTQAQIAYINNRFDAMEDAFNASYYKDPERGYRQYVDPVSFADYQLAQEFGHNVDGYRLSGKFFKRNDSIDARFKMVLWDMNLAYGNADYYNGWYTNDWVYQNNDVLDRSNDSQLAPFWWYKLNNDSFYTDLLKSRWAQYRRANFRQDRIMAAVDSMAQVLTGYGAETRNSQAWPRWNRYVWPNKYIAKNFSDEVNHLKEWLAERLAWMDQQLGFDPASVIKGDVNGDGVVDVTDVNLIINLILGKESDSYLRQQADLDEDGNVDIADVNQEVNIILNKGL